jgi:two-component system CheB/CheR fusion protein
MVDAVADVAGIGPLLRALLADPPVQGDDEPLVQALLVQVRKRTGIALSSYKTPTIRRRIQRRMVATQTHHLHDYIAYLRAHPDEYARLISSLLIRATAFFRDPEVFDYLRDQVLPALMTQARLRGNVLRRWSAGCATGEEAYSLAILLCEALGTELDRFSVRLFATDLDNEALTFARRGIYPRAALSALPPELVAPVLRRDRRQLPSQQDRAQPRHLRAARPQPAATLYTH